MTRSASPPALAPYFRTNAPSAGSARQPWPGAPVRVDRLDLVVARDDLDRFAAWFERVHCERWNERWLDYGGVTVCCEGRPVRVRPLPDIEREHSDVRRLMGRVRARAAAPAPG